MQTVIVTGWHAKGWKEFAHRFVDSFDRFWPGNIPLTVYVEEFVPIPRGEMHHRDECPGLRRFLDENAGNPRLNGREPTADWKPRDRESGYNWRFDAVRFCKQLCYPAHAASSLPDGAVLAWFDADVVTYKPVPEALIEGFLGQNDLIYLGRPGKHSEIGFWAVRLNWKTRAFLKDLATAYPSGRFLEFKEWHSAYVFDRIREQHEFENSCFIAWNLTPNGRGHVWFQHEIGLYTDHCKGNRKVAGISPERPR